jgi:drug/metabolite transporter (DMT)-like permease
MPSPRPAALPFVIAAAILGIAVSGPLAKLAAAPPLAIAFWRVALACAVIGAILGATGQWREWRALSSRDVAVAAGAGVLLAVHFWSWIASLGLTSVAASVLLVNLHPVIIVGGSALFFGEKPRRVQLVGIGIALLGAVVIALGGASAESAGAASAGAASGGAAAAGAPRAGAMPLLGESLALLGAVTVGLYYLAGRSLRQRLSLWPYVGLVYGACLVALAAMAWVNATPLWPFAAREWLLFAAIALGPMLIGHTGFNWSLRYVPAYVVSLALLAEPVGASLLAWLLPGIGEVPSGAVLVGGAAVLVGLGVGSVAERNVDSR